MFHFTNHFTTLIILLDQNNEFLVLVICLDIGIGFSLKYFTINSSYKLDFEKYSSGEEDPLGAFQVDFNVLTKKDKILRLIFLWKKAFYNAIGTIYIE